MHGVWPRRSWCYIWWHCNSVNAHSCDATIFDRIENTRISDIHALYQMRDFSIRPARRKSIYQGRKLEPDLSLLWDESLVSYEWWQSLEIHVKFKVNSGYSSVCGFYIFIHFQACSVPCHLEASVSLLFSLRGRRSKGKGKGIRARDHTRGRREKGKRLTYVKKN